MSSVPPAKSTRQGASDMIFMRKLYYTAGDIQKRRSLADGWRRMRFALTHNNRFLTVAAQTDGFRAARVSYLMLASVSLSVGTMGQSPPNDQDAARAAMAASV